MQVPMAPAMPDRRDVWGGLSSCPETITRRGRGWQSENHTTRTKRRYSMSARRSVLRGDVIYLLKMVSCANPLQ
jgi:hypothetical protein